MQTTLRKFIETRKDNDVFVTKTFSGEQAVDVRDLRAFVANDPIKVESFYGGYEITKLDSQGFECGKLGELHRASTYNNR